MTSSFRRRSLLALSIAIFSACSSEPISAPPAQFATSNAPSANLLGDVGGVRGVAQRLIDMPGLLRNVPLVANTTVTQTVGAAGGTLRIPAAGVTIVVPAGALSSNTVITMTARKGKLVAYDFAPHGTVFAKPLVLTQNLTGTNASLLSIPFIQLGYYSDPSVLTAAGAIVSELLGGTVNFSSWTYTGEITHFSGYMVGVGRGAQLD